MKDSKEYKIAQKVAEKGGKTYYVGGFVRDELLNIENKDVDIEVHGISPEELYFILEEVGNPKTYGKNFGIYSLPEDNIDIAMPRTEHNTGKGHRDFEIYVDPYIDLNTAIKRRDFTINAIYKDVLTEELIDSFNGIQDLKNKIVRHVDTNSFSEDPLRVLRAAQFASRFNFAIAPETIELCRKIDITTLSKERVEEELKKALFKSNNPSLFFKHLDSMNQLNYYFNDINLKYIDEANKYINNINNKYAYLLSSLAIDSSFELNRFTNEKDILSYVENMRNNIHKSYSNSSGLYRIFYDVKDINDFIYLRNLFYKDENLFDEYEKYKQIMAKPYVTGNDLIKAGYEPNEYFNEALKYATDLRLLNVDKDEALRCVIEYIKKISTN